MINRAIRTEGKDHDPEHYEIKEFKLEVLQRSLSHVYYLSGLKFMFGILALGCLCGFKRQISLFNQEDLGYIQKYMVILLFLLLLYDDPLFILRETLPTNAYYII